MSLAALVLAAGSGTRFGGDKLSALFRGEPLIRHAIRAAQAAQVSQILVVAAPGLDIGEWAGEPKVDVLRLASPELSTSLKAGIAALADAGGAFIYLGDMPLIPDGIAAQLAGALGESFAAIPRYGGRQGHPVLLSARAFSAIAGLAGDAGAGKLLKERRDIAFVDTPDEGVLLDIDRVEDITRLEQRRG